MTVSKVSLCGGFSGIYRNDPGRIVVTYLLCYFAPPPGKVSVREISEMKARLFLNLGLVCDHLGEPKRCSEFIRRSVFIAE